MLTILDTLIAILRWVAKVTTPKAIPPRSYGWQPHRDMYVEPASYAMGDMPESWKHLNWRKL